MTAPEKKRLFREEDYERFEQMHAVMEPHVGRMADMVVALLAAGRTHPRLRGIDWSSAMLETVIDSPQYQDWRAAHRKIMIDHAEVMALQLLADPSKLPPQVQGNVALALTAGDLKKASDMVDKARKQALKNERKPVDAPLTHSAVLVGLTEDDP